MIRSWRFKVLRLRVGLSSRATSTRTTTATFLTTFTELLRASILGTLVVGVTLATEYALVNSTGLELTPMGRDRPDMSTFPKFAVPVLAAFIGFYLATVGIVLSVAYQDVSATIRALILENPQTKFYRNALGIAIGAGLALILIESLGIFNYGYLTLGLYVMFVCFSGWAFVRLALGAFDLMNPMVLAIEPIQIFSDTIQHLGSRGLWMDDGVLRGAATNSERILGVLDEIILLAKNHSSTDRDQLATMVEATLTVVREYSRSKYRLGPDSGWFIRKPAYPRWVESEESGVSIALQTSTPLPATSEATPDWLERRVAELVVAAVDACVSTNDIDAALRITRSAAFTARTMSKRYRIDDVAVFGGIIRDGCWNLQFDNETSNAIAMQPPFILTEIMLGWREAVEAWSGEISRAVDETKWHKNSTRAVQIRSTARVSNFAQRLIKEIRAEIEIEGKRLTPDWYLRSALASESIISIREFLTQLPGLIKEHSTLPEGAMVSAETRVAIGSQALQLLQKSELAIKASEDAVAGLETQLQVHEAQPAPEFENIRNQLPMIRMLVLEQIANTLNELQPIQSNSAPDYFGEAFYTLKHHAEEAIANGNSGLIERVFPQIVQAAVTLHLYMISTYRPPIYQFSTNILNSIIDALELSGLALIYESIRGDQSAEPFREAWWTRLQSTENPQLAAKEILNILELATTGWHPMSLMRSNWEIRLARRIVDEGHARPEYVPFGDQPEWDAPILIKMLEVSEQFPNVSLDPHIVFAARVLGPMAGEAEEQLRARSALRPYFESLDFHHEPEGSDQGHGDDMNDEEPADD